MDTLPFERATVVKQTGNLYKISFLPEWDPFQAVLSGKLRLKEGKLTNPVAVGDLVDGIMPAKPARVRGHEEPAVITYVYPRRNYLIRKSANLSREAHIIAANIDMAYLVLSATEPQTPLPFIDRFLVTCQAYGVPATLLVNKYDELLSIPDYKENSDHISEIYTRAGYPVLNVSAFDGTGLKTLSMLLRDKISLFAGISGVGKSSLANTLDPSLSLKTAAISSAHLTGKHTTTFYEMHPLTGGGFFIDSPGIKGFGLLEINRSELYHFFPELFAASAGCKYNSCLHTNEPRCAVRDAVENGLIPAERYTSYLKMLEDPEGGKYRT